MAGIGLRHLLRRLRTAEPSREDAPAGTVIEVDAVGPFDRFTVPARRVVVRAAELQGGRQLSVPALLAALLEVHPPAADRLGRAGLDVPALRRTLSDAVRETGSSPTAAGRVLATARERADRRGEFDVVPEDLLLAVAARPGGLTPILDRATLAALRRVAAS